MPTLGTQTDPFFNFLNCEEQLVKLYLRIKKDQEIKQEQDSQIQYLTFKVDALEESLFNQQRLTK